jgi:hypothetical protein
MKAMTLDDVRELVELGIPVATVSAVCPAPCTIRLTDEAGERYEPDDDGDLAYVFPATTVDPAWPELLEAIHPIEVVASGPIVDLVACHPLASRHALRTGAAITLAAIEHQYWFPSTVRAHRTVNAWLRAGCNGIVLLTRDPYEASRVLRGIEIIQAEDEGHAAELRRLLHMPLPTSSTVITRRPDDK